MHWLVRDLFSFRLLCLFFYSSNHYKFTFYLSGAYILGPRIDRFRDKKSTYISGHSIPLIALGGFILIFGFMAFNGGSQGSISQEGDGKILASAVLTTFLSRYIKKNLTAAAIIMMLINQMI